MENIRFGKDPCSCSQGLRLDPDSVVVWHRQREECVCVRVCVNLTKVQTIRNQQRVSDVHVTHMLNLSGLGSRLFFLPGNKNVWVSEASDVAIG